MNVARVSLIGKGYIRILNVSVSLKESLSSKGLEVVPDGHGFPAIEFTEKEGSLLSNEEFVSIVKLLVSEGVAFCRDFKQMYPPSYVVEELRKCEKIPQDIVTCGFNGKEWVYETA